MSWQVVLNCESHYFEMKTWQRRAVELRRSSAIAVSESKDAIRDSRRVLVEIDDLLRGVMRPAPLAFATRASIAKSR